jgi:hypothetical protein
VERGDEKYFEVQMSFKRGDENVCAAEWLLKRDDEKCFGDRRALRRGDEKYFSDSVFRTRDHGSFLLLFPTSIGKGFQRLLDNGSSMLGLVGEEL